MNPKTDTLKPDPIQHCKCGGVIVKTDYYWLHRDKGECDHTAKPVRESFGRLTKGS